MEVIAAVFVCLAIGLCIGIVAIVGAISFIGAAIIAALFIAKYSFLLWLDEIKDSWAKRKQAKKCKEKRVLNSSDSPK